MNGFDKKSWFPIKGMSSIKRDSFFSMEQLPQKVWLSLKGIRFAKKKGLHQQYEAKNLLAISETFLRQNQFKRVSCKSTIKRANWFPLWMILLVGLSSHYQEIKRCHQKKAK